jgi:hypothetical protein
VICPVLKGALRLLPSASSKNLREEMKHELLGKIENGKLLLNKVLLDLVIEKHQNKKMLVIFADFEVSKSKEQLGYWFGGVLPTAAKFFEMEQDDLYDLLLKKCATRMLSLPNGDMEEVVQRPSAMNMQEFSEFINKAILELSHWGYDVETSENYKIRMEQQLNGELVAL